MLEAAGATAAVEADEAEAAKEEELLAAAAAPAMAEMRTSVCEMTAQSTRITMLQQDTHKTRNRSKAWSHPNGARRSNAVNQQQAATMVTHGLPRRSESLACLISMIVFSLICFDATSCKDPKHRPANNATRCSAQRIGLLQHKRQRSNTLRHRHAPR